MSEIKNKTIEDKLIKATEGDPVMREFLLNIVGNEYKTTHYNKLYSAEIDKAMKAIGGEK